MREIKFRGKRIEDGKWIYGYYVDRHGCPRIIRENDEGELKFPSKKTASSFRPLYGLYIAEAVDPETVGQYTGFKDQNGREIYEGDVLEVSLGEDKGALRSVVEYHAPSFCHRWLNLKEAKLRGINVEPLLWNTHIIFKVIGNIYEHPHLLDWKDAKE